jgi:hypothetical protein
VSDNRFGPNGGHFDPGRHHPRGTNGSAPREMDTRPVPFDDLEDPIDLVAVQADDELINALAAGMSVSSPGIGGYDADDKVAAILAAWKADVDAEPIPELVDVDTAASTVLAAARPPSRRARHLAPVAAAAAFVVLAIGGLSVGSYNARPDDALWPVSKVLYSERAESVLAAERVEERIDNAKQALAAGQPVVAARELAQAEADLASVRPEEGHSELAETQDFLIAKAAETPQGQPVDPAAPLATQPSRPVPSGAASPIRPSPEGSTGTSPEVSSTSSPDSSGLPGRPDGSATPSPDPRRAVAPESGSVSAPPTTEPSGGGEDTRDPQPTTSPSPTGTTEGTPDQPTTTPGQGNTGTPSSSGGGASGSTGATASGGEQRTTTN